MERTAQHIAQGSSLILNRIFPFSLRRKYQPVRRIAGDGDGDHRFVQRNRFPGNGQYCRGGARRVRSPVATAAGLFTAIPAVIATTTSCLVIRGTAFRMDTVTVELLTLMAPKAKPASIGMKDDPQTRQRRFMAEINIIPWSMSCWCCWSFSW